VGLLSDNDGLTLEEEKEALDSPCILRIKKKNNKNNKVKIVPVKVPTLL
jgi:hypothetical protein